MNFITCITCKVKEDIKLFIIYVFFICAFFFFSLKDKKAYTFEIQTSTSHKKTYRETYKNTQDHKNLRRKDYPGGIDEEDLLIQEKLREPQRKMNKKTIEQKIYKNNSLKRESNPKTLQQ